MKQNIIKTIYISSLFLLIISCSETYIELNKGEAPLSMAIDDSELILNVKNSYDVAMTISWTSGTNKGTDCAISYILQIDIADNNYSECISKELGKNIYSLVYTHDELNTLLRDSFNITDGDTANLELRIKAITSNENIDDQFSESVPLCVKTYKPVSSTLYIFGDATPGGWNLNEASKMNSISGEAGGFVWTGDLVPGKLKFLTTNSSLLPAYCKDDSSDDLKLLFRESNDEPDKQFEIETSAPYRIAVNIIDLTVSINITTGPKYNNIYFVGSFTDWSFVEMRQDPTNIFTFRYGAVLDWNGGGEFKFATQDGSYENMYHPTKADAPYTHTEVMQNDNGDYKWLLTQAECGLPYKMALDITEGEETFIMSEFIPFENLYLVGDATPSGWDIDNAVAMKKVDDYNFTWSGSLTAGSMKISCDKKGDWMGAWFMSATDKQEPTGEEQIMSFVDKVNDPTAGDVDRKWEITQAGIYKITCNQLTETITLVKQ